MQEGNSTFRLGSLGYRFDPKYPQTCERLRRSFSPLDRIVVATTHLDAFLTIIKSERTELETRFPLGPDHWTHLIEAIQNANTMTPELHAELIRRYPKFLREPGQRLVDPDPEDPSFSENHLEDDMGPYDEWGIECGDGWFALIDRLCQACEREIDRRTDCTWHLPRALAPRRPDQGKDGLTSVSHHRASF